MALGMMVPGMLAGWLHDVFSQYHLLGANGHDGYINFFLLVMVACVATFVVCRMVRIDPSFGKKKTTNAVGA